MRKIMSIWVPIILLSVILTTVYFRQWITTARLIGRSDELQNADIAHLTSAMDSIQDISTLQIALRVKLYGPAAAEEAVMSAQSSRPAGALPPSVVSAMNRHGVRLVYYRQAVRSAQMQFEGSYDGLVRFLGATGPDLPRLDAFQMERSDKNSLKLTLSVPS